MSSNFLRNFDIHIVMKLLKIQSPRQVKQAEVVYNMHSYNNLQGQYNKNIMQGCVSTIKLISFLHFLASRKSETLTFDCGHTWILGF